MKTIVRIIVDPKVEHGTFVIGGARIVRPKNDMDLARELRTKEVRVHDETAARIIWKELSFHHATIELEETNG
jgi:hypothetical protein